MPGTFSKGNRPRRPGTYVDFIVEDAVRVPPAVGSTVAIPFTHTWGPAEEPVTVLDYESFKAQFGADDSEGQRAVKQAFQGEGLPGRGGAGAVVCYRMTGSAAAKAAHSLSNTTPAVALTLTALHEGTKGNALSVTIQDYAADASKDEMIVYLDGVEVERYRYLNTGVAALAASINAGSAWLTATSVVTGVALAPVTGAALTAGNDGTALIGSDYTGATDALHSEAFGVFVPANLTDAAIQDTLVAWGEAMNAQGLRFFLVFGGDLDEDVADANARSDGFNSEEVLNVGVGSVRDNLYPAGPNESVVLSTAQFAPRVAGALAAAGGRRSLTGMRFAGIDLINGASPTDILKAFDSGTIVLSRDSHLDAPVKVEKGMTTFTSGSPESNHAAITGKPYLVFRNPKFISTMHSIDTVFTQWFTDNVVGQLPVDDNTREACIAHVKSDLMLRETNAEIQGGSTVQTDPEPPPSDDDEFIALLIGLRFGRIAEQVFLSVKAG